MKTKISLLLINLLFYLNITSITIKELLEEHYSNVLFNELLGKGGTGEVWGSSDNNIAIKGGYDKGQCAKIKKEFKIQNQLCNIIQTYNPDLFKRIIILKPRKIIEDKSNNVCAMEIPRLYPLTKSNGNLITQLKLGINNFNQKENGEILIKGHSLGFKETKKILATYPKINPPQSNFNQLFEDIGTLLAIIHFKQKIDGLDTELTLVKDNPTAENYKISLIDFGMCNDLTNDFKKNKTNKIIQKITRALTVEPIYPNPTSPVFNIFMKNYIKIAREEKKSLLAKNVIHNFIGQQFLKKIIKKYLMGKLHIKQQSSFQLKKFIPIVYNWTKGSLLFQVVAYNYNIKEETLYSFLQKIIPKILNKKSKQDPNKFEQILIRKLKQN